VAEGLQQLAAQAQRREWGPSSRLGPYEIVARLGEGGMGQVFLARRADGQYEGRVAIKIMREGVASEFLLSRFRTERQILAALHHPNIAQLLDGGTMPDGRPYIVMEHVSGSSIDRFCHMHAMPVTGRLRLFLKVCDAVQHAHQYLIVHRDLKPSNIIITGDGNPKLLDFGIAKLLRPEFFPGSAAETRLDVRLLTPEYASPEQVRGEMITTASDVYSLGVVLYELLTGRRPHASTSEPRQVERAICEDEAPPLATSITESPSAYGEPTVESLRQRLRGDLEAILAKALRKEPAKRYETVDQFAADIQRHLDGLPVEARRGSLRYKTGKFIRRHQWAVAAGVTALALLCGGTLTTVWQWRRAEQERALAQRRFNEVRKLSNSVLFEIHDSIQRLPGSLPARKLVVQRALEFLDGLSKDASDDPSLLEEVAMAYQAAANIQRSRLSSSLGDTEGARASFRQSLELAQRVRARFGDRPDTLRALALAHYGLGDMQAVEGHMSEALPLYRTGLDFARQAAAKAPQQLPLRRLPLLGFRKVGDMLTAANQSDAAGQQYQAAAEWMQAMTREFPPAAIQRDVMVTSVILGQYLDQRGRAAEANVRYEQALGQVKRILQADPANAQVRRDGFVLAVRQGRNFVRLKQLADAQRQAQAALDAARTLQEGNPADLQAKFDYAEALIFHALVLAATRQWNECWPALEAATQWLESIENLDPGADQTQHIRLSLERQRVEAFEDAGRPADALRSARRYLALAESYAQRFPSTAASTRLTRAREYVAGLNAELGSATPRAAR
jgi:non-specific serine/threonine protein kinase/serine/threonine-protein kinase